MTEEHKPLPVAGYSTQSYLKVNLVNTNKEIEERLLRVLDDLQKSSSHVAGPVDARWLQIARTHFEQGFMALNRSIFQPSRIELPEDK